MDNIDSLSESQRKRSRTGLPEGQASSTDTASDTSSQDNAQINQAERRAPGKRKRTTPTQLVRLVEVFENVTDTPSFDQREALSKELSMTNREVQVWFQNRRAKMAKLKAEWLKKDAMMRAEAMQQSMVNRQAMLYYGQQQSQPPQTQPMPQHHRLLEQKPNVQRPNSAPQPVMYDSTSRKYAVFTGTPGTPLTPNQQVQAPVTYPTHTVHNGTLPPLTIPRPLSPTRPQFVMVYPAVQMPLSSINTPGSLKSPTSSVLSSAYVASPGLGSSLATPLQKLDIQSPISKPLEGHPRKSLSIESLINEDSEPQQNEEHASSSSTSHRGAPGQMFVITTLGALPPIKVPLSPTRGSNGPYTQISPIPLPSGYESPKSPSFRVPLPRVSPKSAEPLETKEESPDTTPSSIYRITRSNVSPAKADTVPRKTPTSLNNSLSNSNSSTSNTSSTPKSSVSGKSQSGGRKLTQ